MCRPATATEAGVGATRAPMSFSPLVGGPLWGTWSGSMAFRSKPPRHRLRGLRSQQLRCEMPSQRFDSTNQTGNQLRNSFQPSKDRSPDIRLPRARRRQGLSSCRARVLGLGDTPSSRCRPLGRAEISGPGSEPRGIESEISTGVTPAAPKHPEQSIHPGYWIINHREPTIPLFDDKPCILIACHAA